MKQNDSEGLQTRREFFKQAAKGALPILGISLFGVPLISSCDRDDEPGNGGNGGNQGNGGNGSCSCSNSCSGSCSDSCSGNCDGCTGSCVTTNCTYM